MNAIFRWFRSSPIYKSDFIQYFSLGVAFSVLLLWLVNQASGFFALIVSLLILVALGGVFGWVLFRILISRSNKTTENPSTPVRAYLIQMRDDLDERDQWLIRTLNIAIDYWNPITFVSSILLAIWVFGKLLGLADLMISSANLEYVQKQIRLTEQQAEATAENAKLQARLEVAELNAQIRPLKLIDGDWRSLGFWNEAGEAEDYLTQFHCEAGGQTSHGCEVAARYDGEERTLIYYALAFKNASSERQRNSRNSGQPYIESSLGIPPNALEDFDGQIFFQGLVDECFAPERMKQMSISAYNEIQATEQHFSNLLDSNNVGWLQGLDRSVVSDFIDSDSGLDEYSLVEAHENYIRNINIMVTAYSFCHDRLNELLEISGGFQTEHRISKVAELSHRAYIQTESYEVHPLEVIVEPPARNLNPAEKALIETGIFD